MLIDFFFGLCSLNTGMEKKEEAVEEKQPKEEKNNNVECEKDLLKERPSQEIKADSWKASTPESVVSSPQTPWSLFFFSFWKNSHAFCFLFQRLLRVGVRVIVFSSVR